MNNNSYQSQIYLKILLSLATSPFVLAIIIAGSIIQSLIEAGEALEEVFRGDRLPVLNFPQRPETERDKD